MRNEMGEVTLNTTELQRFKVALSNFIVSIKLENPEEIDEFTESFIFPRL